MTELHEMQDVIANHDATNSVFDFYKTKPNGNNEVDSRASNHIQITVEQQNSLSNRVSWTEWFSYLIFSFNSSAVSKVFKKKLCYALPPLTLFFTKKRTK